MQSFNKCMTLKMNINKKLKALVSIAFLLSPAVALADGPPLPAFGGIPSVWSVMVALMNLIWPIFFGLAVIMFIVAGGMFLTARGEAGQIATARMAVVWGVVGVIVGILAFSIPFILRNTLGV